MDNDILIPDDASGGQEPRRLILETSSLARALASEDPEEGFRTALDFVETLLNVDAAQIVLRELNGQKLATVAASHIPPGPPVSGLCLGEGLARAAMESSELLCVPDLATDARDALGSLCSAGYSSSLCAPILIGDNPAGALLALTKKPRTFTIGDMELLWEISRAVAEGLMARGPGWIIVVREPRDGEAEAAEQKLGDLRFFNELSDAIISSTSLTELAESALRISMQAVEAGIGSLMLFDPRTRRLTIAAARGLPQNLVKSISQAIGEGIAGWVAQHQKPLLLHSVEDDFRFQALHPRREIASALSIPLRTRDRLIGVLNLARITGQPHFTDRQSQLLETVANQLAIAIERMRLHQEMKRRSLQLSTLIEVGKTVTSMLDLGVVSEQIAVQARNLVRAASAWLFYYDPINDRVRFAARSGGDAGSAEERRRLANELALAGARLNRLVRGRELRQDPGRSLVASLEAGDWYAVPFRHRGHRVAVTVIEPRSDQPPDPDSDELLEQFGSLAGVAIQNARTYNRQRAIASVMQESMLNVGPVRFEGLEIAHRLIPEHEVGGDYYDFIPLDRDRLGVVMADVSGSSVRAAAYSVVGKHALRAYARESLCPAEVLHRLNQMICAEADAEMFISVFYGVFDLSRGTLTYAMAGHEPPVLLRADTGRTELLRANGLLLGVQEEAEFQLRQRRFAPGDTLVLYTDGLTEGRYRRRQFGIERVREFLRANRGRPAQELLDGLVTSRMRYTENRMTDDTSIVIIRARPR